MRHLMDLELHLDERVYRPAEDSLLLADTLEPPADGWALDVGTGTGLAALRLATEGACVVATDVNPIACRLTRRNAEANELDVHAVQTDLADGLAARFTAIACNPPYLPTDEPRQDLSWRALESGPEGASTSLRLLDELPRLLDREGRAWLVTSTRQPLSQLQQRAEANGLTWTVAAEQNVGRFEQLRIAELRRKTDPTPGRHR